MELEDLYLPRFAVKAFTFCSDYILTARWATSHDFYGHTDSLFSTGSTFSIRNLYAVCLEFLIKAFHLKVLSVNHRNPSYNAT